MTNFLLFSEHRHTSFPFTTRSIFASCLSLLGFEINADLFFGKVYNPACAKSTSHLSHPSLLIPVYSQLCNVTIFVKQHLKNFPCITKATEKTLNYCMCSYLAIACQPRNIRSHETRQSEGEKTAGWCWWQMGWSGWIFFFQGTVSSLFPLLSLPLCWGVGVGWGNLSLLHVARKNDTCLQHSTQWASEEKALRQNKCDFPYAQILLQTHFCSLHIAPLNS